VRGATKAIIGKSRFWLAATLVGIVAFRAGLADPLAFHIPEQPLSRSLNDVARLSKTNILFSPGDIPNVRAPALDGVLTAQDAVRRLIAGTDLEAVWDKGGLIVKAKVAAAAPPLPKPAERIITNAFDGETVTITGIRESWQRDLNVKRDSIGLVDVITNETIGKFPETNLASAIMRIPGVNVNRRIIGMVGIDSSIGDPTEITVRGFGPTFNVVLVDGRNIGSSIGTRSFDFSLLAGDMVEEVDVHKSPDASLTAGAIGATINVKNPRPFDQLGLRSAASVSTTYSPEAGKFTPNGMVLFSDTFAHDRLGVLVAATYNEISSRTNEVAVWGWEGTYMDACQFAGGGACGASLTPDTTRPVWFIQDYGVYKIDNWSMRENGRFAAQWTPSEALLVTLNADFARNDLKEWQYAVAIWNNASEMRNVRTSTNGTIVDFTRANTPTDFHSQINETVQQSYDVGLNARWNVNSRWTIEADGDLALSAQNPGNHQGTYSADVGYGPSCASDCPVPPINGATIGIAVAANGGHVLPHYTSYGPNDDASRFIDPTIIGSHVMVLTTVHNRNSVGQARLQAKWDGEDIGVLFGIQYLANHMRLESVDDFSNNAWQAYAGYGPDSHNYYVSGPNAGLPAGVHLPKELFRESYSTANFLPGWSGGNQLPPRILKYDVLSVFNYLEALGDPVTPTTIPGFNWGCCDPAYHGKFEAVSNPAGYQRIFENNLSGYLTVTGEAALAGIPLTYHGGLRLERTELYSEGRERLPIALTVMAADHTAFLTSYGPVTPVAAAREYDYLLPNIDLTVHPTPEVQIRLNASRTLTRPPLTNISPATTLSSSERVGSLVATGQNPYLEPYVSNNFDITGEWYNAANSYVSVDAFFKNVSNFVIATTVERSINDVIDPTTGRLAQFRVSSYINGPSANVYGVEFAVQQVLGDTGFGVQMNATLVGTDRPYNPKDISTSNFAVTGLADSANMVAFYDKNGFQVRLSANWHDSFLEHFGQMQPNSAFGAEPVIVDPAWDMTLNMGLSLSRELTAYLEATNLLNATYSTRGRFHEQVLNVVDYGRRITVGLHYKL
jgi:TonB-dependent receptor